MSHIVQSTTLRNNLSDVLKTVETQKPDYLLIAVKQKLRAALVNLDLFEDLLALASPAYLKSVKEARSQVKKGAVFTHDQVFGELS